jgi:hypothetical protein
VSNSNAFVILLLSMLVYGFCCRTVRWRFGSVCRACGWCDPGTLDERQQQHERAVVKPLGLGCCHDLGLDRPVHVAMIMHHCAEPADSLESLGSSAARGASFGTPERGIGVFKSNLNMCKKVP